MKSQPLLRRKGLHVCFGIVAMRFSRYLPRLDSAMFRKTLRRLSVPLSAR
jgi:hypothetical protein